MSSESMWMLKCCFRMCRDLMVGDLEQAWYLSVGRYTAPPCLLTMNFTRPWWICPSGTWILSVCVSCSLRVVAYLWDKGKYIDTKCNSRQLGEDVGGVSWYVAYMAFVSFTKILSSFRSSRIEYGVVYKAYSISGQMTLFRFLVLL